MPFLCSYCASRDVMPAGVFPSVAPAAPAKGQCVKFSA